MNNDCYRKYAVERAQKRIPTLYALFWVWARGEGYNVAMGAMKEAWAKYAKTEMSEQDKLLFSGEYGEEIKNEFNAYCAQRIASERELYKNQNKMEI